MITLTLDLPEAVAEFLQSQVAEGKYTTASDYVARLLEAERQRQGRARVDALLLEGIQSGPSAPLDRQEWDSIREEVRQRLAAEGADA